MTTSTIDPSILGATALSTEVISARREIVLYVEVRYGNPNGDPDMLNMPRMDPGTGRGVISDVAIKRTIRDYVADAYEGAEGYGIFISDGVVLERLQQEAFDSQGTGGKKAAVAEESAAEQVSEEADGAQAGGKGKGKGKGAAVPKKKPNADAGSLARAWLNQRYFDCRAFGAVYAGKTHNAGSVNGPIQVTFGESVDPIDSEIMEVAITRCAVTSEKDEAKERTIGRKHVVPYALYRVEVRVSPSKAAGKNGTGFSEADMKVLEEALLEGFAHRQTASKGHMETRAMFVFEHESALGNAPAYSLFERVSAEKLVERPRKFSDYRITVNEADMPKGVTMRRVR